MIRGLAVVASCAAAVVVVSSSATPDHRAAQLIGQSQIRSVDADRTMGMRDTGSVLGNYTVRVCRGGPCSTDRDSGVVRLLLIDLDRRLADSLQRKLNGSRGDSTPKLYGMGCFGLQRVIRDSETVAGWGGGPIMWQYDSQTARISFPAGRSIDIAYSVEARLTRGRMNGVGRSRFDNGEQPEVRIDSIVGHRIGPPDTMPCSHVYSFRGPPRPLSILVLPCDSLQGTLDSEDCYRDTLAASERALEETERAIADSLHPRARAAFDSAASLWRAYRARECKATHEEFTDASIAPIAILSCEINLTRARRRELPDLYSDIAGRSRMRPI